jgi:hypothetical protein
MHTPMDKAAITVLSAQVNMFAEILGVPNRILPDALTSILTSAFEYSSEQYGIRAAQEWAAGYVFPPHLLQRDIDTFRRAGNCLTSTARLRQEELAATRLSLSRIHTTFGATGARVPDLRPSDFHHLCTVAVQGIQIHLPAGFTPTSTPPPLRNKYVQVAPAIHRMYASQLATGTVMVLPQALVNTIPGIHYSCQHWTTNKGKPQGRAIGDVASPVTELDMPLNGASAADKHSLRMLIQETWDPIVHPTLTMLMRMILVAATTHGWENITLWKKDLQGAFTLLWFRPCDTRLLAFPLTDGLAVVHLAGMFGWVGMPYIFQVLTRALVALCATLIFGACMMYVDDFMGVSPTYLVDHDMTAVDTGVTGLLGPQAIAEKKNEFGRELEFIGWSVNLDRRSVTLSRVNFLKMVYAFFSVDAMGKVTCLQVEVMASLASRCSQLCRQMRPYTKALYDAISTYPNRHVRHSLPSLAKVDIAVWRAFLLLSHFNPATLHRPIESFADRPPTLQFRYDASLVTLAVGVYVCDHPHSTPTLIAYTVIHVPFPTTAARKQNTFEFLAVLLGVLLCHTLGISHRSCHLFGDSISSLTWAERDRAASILARRTNIGYTLAAAHTDITVTAVTHVPGKQNVVYDGLTRSKTAAQVCLPPNRQVVFPPLHPVHQYIALCDPDAPLSGYTQHASLSLQFTAHLRSTNMVLPHTLPTQAPPPSPQPSRQPPLPGALPPLHSS